MHDVKPPVELRVEVGPNVGRVYPLTQGNSVLGREASGAVGVQILSPDVSRQHARLTLEHNQISIEDLGSSNGTFVNGVQIGQAPVRLTHEDQIRLGKSVTLRIIAPMQAHTTLGAPPLEATVLGEEPPPPIPQAPPVLTVAVSRGERQTVALTSPVLLLGRGSENDIVIPARTVSRRHARLDRDGLVYRLTVLPDASNPILFEGQPLTGPHLLQDGDVLRIGSDAPGMMVTLTYSSPATAPPAEEALAIQFGAKSTLQLGRDPSNDMVLDAPNVSRFHAQIERIGQRYRMQDLRSSNGTFVNDHRVEGHVWLSQADTIRIGPYRIVMGQDALAQFDESGGLRADALNLQKWIHSGLNILQDISVLFRPREFIVIVGQSGGGKTTLMDAIAGYRPASHGRVFVNDVDVYRNFDAVRNNIGYVPQRDIIHMELTPYEALDYAAKLRMPPDTTPEERHQRVRTVLDDLDLTHRQDVQISGLSGGQQKRVSIGVELLTKPGLFFLDEATSGLDPGTETALMQLLRRLADQGRTIVLVTHATKNVMLADKALFLARGGYLAWFGPPDEALTYFDQFRSDRERRAGDMEFDQIYALLEDPRHGSPENWATRFRDHPAYQKYIEAPQAPKRESLNAAKPSALADRPSALLPSTRRISSLRQFRILSARNLKILTRDRISLLLMLGAAPLVSLLDLLLALMMGRDQFSFNEGSVANIGMTFFLLSIFAMFVGGLSQMREIVKEVDIFRRERLVNLKIAPYVFSKVWVAILLAAYHGAAYVIIHYLAYRMPGGGFEFILMYITMTLAAIAGMMLGLFASAVAPNANTAPMLIILLIMPQVVLSGALVPLPSALSAPTATRWTFENMMGISGLGSDVAADPCWALPVELRDIMTLDDKTAHCRCMGLNILREGTCQFPGLGRFYDPVINQPKPIEPVPLRDKPPDPMIPPEPVKPEDESDSLAMADYFEALETYQEEVAQIQDLYRADMEAYEAEADIYQATMEDYQERYLEWELTRSAAVEGAEGLVDSFHQDYGWTFVDTSALPVFLMKVGRAWIALVLLSSAMLLGVLWMVKRKDVL